jgi:hypothetical protein
MSRNRRPRGPDGRWISYEDAFVELRFEDLEFPREYLPPTLDHGDDIPPRVRRYEPEAQEKTAAEIKRTRGGWACGWPTKRPQLTDITGFTK